MIDNEALSDGAHEMERMHDRDRPKARRFICPATGVAITRATCSESRRSVPGVCALCTVGSPCKKCGRSFSAQEARAGFTTCEFCG